MWTSYKSIGRGYFKLMGFFDYNCDHPEGRHILHQDFPGHYVWKLKEKNDGSLDKK